MVLLVLMLPFVFVAYKAECGLFRRVRSINRRMTPHDRKVGRVVTLAWFGVVAVLFVTVWGVTGDVGKGILALAVGSGAGGLLGPMVIVGLRLPSRREMADPNRAPVGPSSPGWKEDNAWMEP